jgi:hypothetical protein
MRDAVQAASRRIKWHIKQSNADGAPESSATPVQIYPRSRLLSFANVSTTTLCQDISVLDGPDEVAVPDIRVVMQYLDKPNLRGKINAMARLIEEHGAYELQRIGVLSQEGGMCYLRS